jgi:S-formylglutathione hydrolase FrmB
MKLNGKIILESLGSLVLKENPLGDPRLREVPVYIPPSYPERLQKRYPVIYYLSGFTGTPEGVTRPHRWKESVVEKLDRLISARKIPEAIMVIPDCFTRYGGSQYMNSSGTGRYEDHIVDELVGYVDGKYRTLGTPETRVVMGKSSGGYGALRLVMQRPGVFGHAVSHSGDMFFENCYGVEFPKCVNALAKFGGFTKFLKEFTAAREKMSYPHELVNLAGMASCYSPNAKNPLNLDLPFDEQTGELTPKVWQRWLAEDPVHMAQKSTAVLKNLKTLYFDCGRRDEFYLHLGARKLSQVLKKAGVAHVYEEHEKGHFDMSGRYDLSLVRLGKALKKNGAK